MKIRVEVGTDESGDSVYVHYLEQKEGQTVVDTMIDAIEAGTLLYNSCGIKSIALHIEDE